MLTMKYSLKDFEAGKELNAMAERMSNQQECLKEIGLYMLGSIGRNFQEGGRPAAWEVSKRATAQAGKTLVDTSRLKNSLTMKVEGEKTLKLGTGIKYAAIHNFGGTIDKNVTIKEHWRTISKAFGKAIPERSRIIKSHSRHMKLTMPKREFLLFQGEDWTVIHKIENDYLLPNDKA